MKYNIIYADPPWSYRDKASSGKRGSIYKYPSMTMEDIKKMDISSITAKDALLFLWVTGPLMLEQAQVIDAWGFKYVNWAFVWTKRTKKNWLLKWGMGSWTRSNAELCLLGIKGKPKRVSAAVHQVIDATSEVHSAKPPETRDRIVELVGDLPRVELFARQKVGGWDHFGNELEGGIIINQAGDRGGKR